MKKILFVVLMFCCSLGFSQSLNYKIARKFESQNKNDKSLRWYLKSEKSIDSKFKTEFYEKIFNISINIDSGLYGTRADYLSMALKYHSKYNKQKNHEIFNEQSQRLKLNEAIKEELVLMIYSKKRNNAIYSFFKENVHSAEENMILVLNDLSKVAVKSNDDWKRFYGAYYNLFKDGSIVNLSANSEEVFHRYIQELLDQSFLQISPDITRNISELEYFQLNYGLFLKTQVLTIYNEVEEKIKANDFGSLWKLWNLEKEIYLVNPDLLDKDILKRSFLRHILAVTPSYIGKGLNDFVLKQNCVDGYLCFDSDPFFFDGIEELKDKPLVMNNELIQLVFLSAIENNLDQVSNWNTLNPIESVIKSDSIFRVLNSKKILKEHLTRNYKHYTYYSNTCDEYLEFNNSLTADLLYEIARERILSHVLTKDFSSATEEFFIAVKMFPIRNWSDQKKWFYPHFNTRLINKETTMMGKDVLIATNFFKDDKDFKVLIGQYRNQEFLTTLKNNNIKPDSWTGNTSSCDCGTMSDEYLKAGLESLKFYRRYVGLPDSIFFREKENRDAQCAALIMQAANDKITGEKIYLDHHPKSTVTCYSEEGYYGASTGNLIYGTAMSGSVASYVDDFGQGATGHRAWVLAPDLVSYGFGSTSNANCLVWGGGEQRNDLNNFYKNVPFSWPPAGEVIDELVKESDNWTFALQGADFSKSKVKVISGKMEIPIKINYYQGFQVGYGGFSYLNFNFGMDQITERQVFKGGEQSFTYWRSKAIKGKIYEVFIDNVIDAYGNKRTFKYQVEIK